MRHATTAGHDNLTRLAESGSRLPLIGHRFPAAVAADPPALDATIAQGDGVFSGDTLLISALTGEGACGRVGVWISGDAIPICHWTNSHGKGAACSALTNVLERSLSHGYKGGGQPPRVGDSHLFRRARRGPCCPLLQWKTRSKRYNGRNDPRCRAEIGDCPGYPSGIMGETTPDAERK